MRRLAALLSAALLLGSATAAAPAKHFMWRISDGSHALFLVGSVHVLRQQDYPLPAELEAAYAAADGLVEEIDLGQLDPQSAEVEMMERGSYPAGQTLKSTIPAPLYKDVAAEATRRGMDMGLLDSMRPWMAGIALADSQLERAGFDPTLGVDVHFSNEAHAGGKPVIGLEEPDFQLGLLAGLPEDAQEALLRQSLQDAKDFDADMKQMLDAWHTGDASVLEQMLQQDFAVYPEIYQPVMVQRNRAWMPKLTGLLQSNKRYFVVVGALHLVGPDGLLAQFKKAGFKVEQL